MKYNCEIVKETEMNRHIEVIEIADGEVVINIEEAQRMRAITEIAIAINKLASALCATPDVTIKDCKFSGISKAGVSVRESDGG